jgi:hypothetical protein
MKSFLHTLPRELDRNLAIVALALSVLGFLTLAITSSNTSNIIIIGFLGASFFVYLVLRPTIQPRNIQLLHSSEASEASEDVILAINISFLVLLFFSVFLIITRSDTYTRPVSFFVIAAILVGIIAAEILFSGKDTLSDYSILIKIILLGILLRWVSLVMFPSSVWFDPWYHKRIIETILSTSHIPQVGLQSYEKLPVYHVLISALSQFTGLNFKGSFLIFICPVIVIAQALLIFMIGNVFIPGKKIPLLASLLLMIGDYNISNGIIEFPNGFAIIFILAVIYINLKMQKFASVRWIVLAIIIMLTIILTHTLASMAMAILLLFFWLSSIIYRWLFWESEKRLIASLSLAMLFTITMFTWWMYASGHYIFIVKAITWAFQADNYFTEAPIKALEYISSVPILETLMDKLGFTVYFFFSSIGCLFLISPRSGSRISGFVYSFGSIVLAVIGFLGTVFNLLFIPTRWIFMSQMTLSIPAAIGICMITSRIMVNRRIWIACLVSGMAFFTISNTMANFDTPVLSPKMTIRVSLYSSELQSIDTITAYTKKTISVDQLAFAYIFNTKEEKIQLINKSLDSMDFTPLMGSVIILRKSIIDDPFYASSSIWRIYYDPRILLLNEGINCVYDSGSTMAYFRTKDDSIP